MKRGFRIHEHTADVTLECWAPTLKEAFEEAAHATFEVMLDTSTVKPVQSTHVTVSGIDLKELLVEWIGKLIALVDIKSQFFSKFSVTEIAEEKGGWELEAVIQGEDVDLDRHVTRTGIKAMTYADMKIETNPKRTNLWFTLDL